MIMLTVIPKELIQMVDVEGECRWPSQHIACHYRHTSYPRPSKQLKQKILFHKT